MPGPDSVTHGIIDVGSNAIRMYVVSVQGAEVQHLSKRRAPVRLGSYVFDHGMISEELQTDVLEALRGFQVEFASQGVQRVTAIATSATREAHNHPELVARIRNELGIELSVISGQAEAELLATAMGTRIDASRGRSLWLDLGGGSVEIVTVDAESERTGRGSYPLGALRLLRETSTDCPPHGPGFVARLNECILHFEAEIRSLVSGPVHRFGAAGGSLVSLERLMRKNDASLDAGDGIRLLELNRLTEWLDLLANRTCAQRMSEFDLPPDRADTIVPAAAVTVCIAKIADIAEVLVPDVDLKDALVEQLRNPAR